MIIGIKFESSRGSTYFISLEDIDYIVAGDHSATIVFKNEAKTEVSPIVAKEVGEKWILYLTRRGPR